MKSNSQKLLVLLAFVVSVLASSISFAAAVPVSNVANTPHNFAIGGGNNVYTAAASTGLTQVCVFCHAPHNAGQTRLLWNKAGNSVTNFRLYTSSGSLTSTTKHSTLPAGSPSLLCLSCHDGKTAMNILHSTSAGIDATSAGYPGNKLIPTSNAGNAGLTMPMPYVDPITGNAGPNMNIGGGSASTAGDDLTNDHPIGFSYTAAVADKGASGGLRPIGDPLIANTGIRFFGPTNRVECSTCHDPHIDSSLDATLKPFLNKSNVGSALCLSCHNK